MYYFDIDENIKTRHYCVETYINTSGVACYLNLDMRQETSAEKRLAK